jgi:predicted RNA-binding Zn-ribbon protein involved in translation (DUF1610 family)
VPILATCNSCGGKFNAPDSAAGKRTACPKCGGVIDIPVAEPAEEILEAEVDPAAAFEDDDFEVEPPAEIPEGRRPCPKCGEMILLTAVKCRFCGEIFDTVLRQKEEKTKRLSSGEDSDLSTLDWVLAILCSGIGCIVGIVYIIQGKPKGTKMLLISLGMQLLWGVLQTLLRVAVQH